ncbi:MAG: dicarboxylate/amino acid:cation symporter [Eubacteriales bacterium]|nr:dicarboxylate/amino acid:cation symporter [Eubacteriales bacterium]
MNTQKKNSLVIAIFIATILAVFAGLLMQEKAQLANDYIKPFGNIFLNLIKTIVVPLVIFSITQGVISMQDIKKVGLVGIKTIIFYLITTLCAITIALIVANVFDPAGGFQFNNTALEYKVNESPSFMTTIVNIFPDNIIKPLQNASMLQVIVISLFLGFGIIVSGEKGRVIANFVNSASEVCITIMGFIIKLSPIGVFCLLCPVVASNGPAILRPLLRVILVAYLAYIIHTGVVYSIIVSLFAKINPFTFFSKMAPAMVLAFASASSVGTLPLNMQCVEKLGGKREIASFTLPLGATINMDGTAIYQGVCAIFIAHCFGIQLDISQQLTIILTATLASIGTAGVPGSGMIMLAMVLQSVGLPVEGIALVAGIDRIFDMGRTTLNITGDAACTLAISKNTK